MFETGQAQRFPTQNAEALLRVGCGRLESATPRAGYGAQRKPYLVDFQVAGLDEASNEAERLMREAIARDGPDTEAHAYLSNVLRIRGELALARAEAESVLAANPNLAIAHRMLAAALIFSGNRSDGIAAAQTSLRLEPRGPSTAAVRGWIAGALYFSGDYAGCAEAARRVIRSHPGYTHPYRWLAAALGQLGPVEEAKIALEKAIAVAPASFEMYVRNRVPWIRPEDHDHLLDGLRKAGWRDDHMPARTAG